MTVTERKPSLLARLNPFYQIAPKRAIWLDDDGNFERNQLGTAEARRLFRSNADVLAIYGAVFAAVKRRVRAIATPEIVLLRGDEEVESHPALDALSRVNESLTTGQGLGMIEQHKLTVGSAYWIKRRDGLGIVREFEIWNPEKVKVVPTKDKEWVPAAFELSKAIGTKEIVAPEDVVWFRHLVDPRNPLNGLSPISAVRTEVDTGIEAQRFNQRYFDNALSIGAIFTSEDILQAEAGRIEQDLERKFRGTDRAFRAMVVGGDLKHVESKPPHKDMEFIVQANWGVEEVARVMEMAPELLGQGSRTYENAPAALREFWGMIKDQLNGTLDEFNEFYITPDFGPEYKLVAKYDMIPALQADGKLQAEIDEIELRTAATTVNEVRERDGKEPVEWGDVPIMPLNMVPFGSIPTIVTPGQLQTEVVEEEPRTRAHAREEEAMRSGWERRLQKELRGIIKHLTAADARALEAGDVDSYDWNWWAKYGDEVMKELEITFAASLAEAGFVEAPLLGAKEIAVRYAQRRGAELLQVAGRQNIVNLTKMRVNKLVAEMLEKGDSIQTLSKNLRADFAFSPSRAEMIARTETAFAQTEGSLKSYQSLGHEGKEWLTAGDERVDAGGQSTPCIDAEAEGAIALGRRFNNGFEGPPAHPRCRCTLLPVSEMPRG